MRTAINRLKELDNERQLLIRQLEMWTSVEEQGINPDDVDTFTMVPSLLSPNDRREYEQAKAGHHVTARGKLLLGIRIPNRERLTYRPLIYNCVTLKNGSRVKLDPMIVAP